MGNNSTGTDRNVGNDTWNRNVFSCWQKVNRERAEITLSDRLFQMVAPHALADCNRRIRIRQKTLEFSSAGSYTTSVPP